ncbi:DUF5626 family protein [Lactiplantibacillus plantarum]|uniref:DUF5626 family protein n=1 Tax=Lactiplantibacillus plantarum TaxID=1590 RepID=UPI000D21C094|nr:hypothetical protein DA080_02565 [Lactiplantibacillus plantarum]AVW06685.1 hypothetical protein DA076_02510 [Lactiplantibacillus plantarum]
MEKIITKSFITILFTLFYLFESAITSQATSKTYHVSAANYSWSASYNVKVKNNKIISLRKVKLHAYTGKIIGYSTAHTTKRATLTIVKSYKVLRTRIHLNVYLSNSHLKIKAY